MLIFSALGPSVLRKLTGDSALTKVQMRLSGWQSLTGGSICVGTSIPVSLEAANTTSVAQQPFPESGREWQQDAPVIDLMDVTSLIPVQSSPTQMAVNGLRGYTSCWEAMKLKALNAGTPLEDIMLDYRVSIIEALREWLRDYGQPYAIFRAELRMWRDLCMEQSLL
jgi:hypothetical protein